MNHGSAHPRPGLGQTNPSKRGHAAHPARRRSVDGCRWEGRGLRQVSSDVPSYHVGVWFQAHVGSQLSFRCAQLLVISGNK